MYSVLQLLKQSTSILSTKYEDASINHRVMTLFCLALRINDMISLRKQ